MKANSQRQRAVWGPAGERLIAANEIAGAAAVVMPNVCVEVATVLSAALSEDVRVMAVAAVGDG